MDNTQTVVTGKRYKQVLKDSGWEIKPEPVDHEELLRKYIAHVVVSGEGNDFIGDTRPDEWTARGFSADEVTELKRLAAEIR